jgi:hypothetical protein
VLEDDRIFLVTEIANNFDETPHITTLTLFVDCERQKWPLAVLHSAPLLRNIGNSYRIDTARYQNGSRGALVRFAAEHSAKRTHRPRATCPAVRLSSLLFHRSKR